MKENELKKSDSNTVRQKEWLKKEVWKNEWVKESESEWDKNDEKKYSKRMSEKEWWITVSRREWVRENNSKRVSKKSKWNILNQREWVRENE